MNIDRPRRPSFTSEPLESTKEMLVFPVSFFGFNTSKYTPTQTEYKYSGEDLNRFLKKAISESGLGVGIKLAYFFDFLTVISVISALVAGGYLIFGQYTNDVKTILIGLCAGPPTLICFIFAIQLCIHGSYARKM
mmetsp:Transcript_17157/g.15045  ORF Transcript_17157/g.15045 Transcript_17157/m.15045 type:complete len:135 (+) Transcript_17157:80-484(+)